MIAIQSFHPCLPKRKSQIFISHFPSSGLVSINASGDSVEMLPSSHDPSMHKHLIQRTPRISQFSLRQLILPSCSRHEDSLPVKRRNNASKPYCHHTRHPMRLLGQADDEWRLQSWWTHRSWPCRIVDRQCLQS